MTTYDNISHKFPPLFALPLSVIETLTLSIISEVEKDVQQLEKMPFTGDVVAEAFGNDRAALVALANICNTLATELTELKREVRENQ